MTLSPEDRDLIEREASAHAQLEPWAQSSRPIPKSVNRVDGCNCGGIEWHRVDCTITGLDRAQALANIDAANERSIAYCGEINRIRKSTHKVSWEALYVDMDPSAYSRPFSTTRVPTGAVELSCTCSWVKVVPAAQVDSMIAEHEERAMRRLVCSCGTPIPAHRAGRECCSPECDAVEAQRQRDAEWQAVLDDEAVRVSQWVERQMAARRDLDNRVDGSG